ncbi:MAG: GNAT family N-acetyltransferase [Chloroflexota bacterium]
METRACQQTQILPASWRDFRPVMALEKACFPQDSWPWFDILAALTFPETVRLKAVLEGQVVGFVIGDRRQRQEVGWIASIGVHPDLRRNGIGRKLLQACECELATPRIRLTLRPSNVGALRLYQTSGYVEIDRLERYYHNGEGAIVMEKVLASSEARRS